LRLRGKLRGCIGQLSSSDPLTQVVAYCARAAALEDPRFHPVSPDELAGIDIEISVLSPLKTIAPGEIEVGKHGLMVSQAWQRGVLLPQVAAEFHWGVERFLEETCVKAGLGRHAWKDPATRICAFTAEVFSESDLGAGEQEALETQGRTEPGYSSST
jgi:AmmeMemoRadiSam system protein A